MSPIILSNMRAGLPVLETILNELKCNSRKAEIKICFSPDSYFGLGDIFGALNMLLYKTVHLREIKATQIFIQLQNVYEGIENYLDFNEIKFIPHNQNLNDFNFDIIVGGGCYEGLFLLHSAHFRNFIRLNDRILNLAKQFSRSEGLHFRFRPQELGHDKENDGFQKQLNAFINSLEQIYKKETLYFLSSDSIVCNEISKIYSNIITIPKNNNQWRDVGGRKDAYFSCMDIACLSLCNTIHMFLDSGFPYLATLLSMKPLPLKDTTLNLKHVCSSLGYIHTIQ